ncbi:MAG: guanylate kinase [Candidatus Thiosymbion ectosymbiont of Robbea hypermnestra]|nr:guanylate kinase [Candidatus Thiosymbion ectosymbiont of Robbea hypermnestra]
MNRGIPFILSAASGAGKTSLIQALLEREPSLELAVSFTTRVPRSGERDGVHYHFVAPDRFQHMVAAGEFLEHAQVFGNRYGTAEATVRARLEQGRDLVLEIDWQGARQVRACFPGAVSVFILPPSAQALERRLRNRGLDSDQVIADRMAAARAEMSRYREYDYLVVNDRFDTALDDLICLVRAERLRRSHAEPRLGTLLAGLTGQEPKQPV